MAEIDTPNSDKSAVPEAQGHFDRGMDYLEAASNIASKELEPDSSAEERFDQEFAALEEAIKEFSEAVQLDPKFALAYFQRGETVLDLVLKHALRQMPMELYSAEPPLNSKSLPEFYAKKTEELGLIRK